MVKNHFQNTKLRIFLMNSPLNLVVGSLGVGKTAFLTYISHILKSKSKRKNYTTYSSYPLIGSNILSLENMNLLSKKHRILGDKSLLL